MIDIAKFKAELERRSNSKHSLHDRVQAKADRLLAPFYALANAVEEVIPQSVVIGTTRINDDGRFESAIIVEGVLVQFSVDDDNDDIEIEGLDEEAAGVLRDHAGSHDQLAVVVTPDRYELAQEQFAAMLMRLAC
jgi:hypothetical protein